MCLGHYVRLSYFQLEHNIVAAYISGSMIASKLEDANNNNKNFFGLLSCWGTMIDDDKEQRTMKERGRC
jgi:hypothetical protein